MTPAETLELLATIQDAFQGRFQASQRMAALWAQMLADLPASEVSRALRACLAESPHPPTISELRTRVAEARVDAPDTAAAWGEVMAAISRHGRLREPTFSHPAVTEVVSAMGWLSICDAPADSTSTLRAQFERLFRERAQRQRRDANVLALETHLERTGQLTAGDAIRRLLGTGGAK